MNTQVYALHIIVESVQYIQITKNYSWLMLDLTWYLGVKKIW